MGHPGSGPMASGDWRCLSVHGISLLGAAFVLKGKACVNGQWCRATGDLGAKGEMAEGEQRAGPEVRAGPGAWDWASFWGSQSCTGEAQGSRCPPPPVYGKVRLSPLLEQQLLEGIRGPAQLSDIQ